MLCGEDNIAWNILHIQIDWRDVMHNIVNPT